MLAVAIDNIINCACVVFLLNLHMKDIFADKHLLLNPDNLVLAVLVEDDDIVKVRAVADKLVLLHACADEALLTVYVQLLVGFQHTHSVDVLETAYLGKARIVSTVFPFQVHEPIASHLREIVKVTVNLLNLRLDVRHQFVRLVLVELQDALHLDFHEAYDVVFCNLAHKL